MERRFTKEDVRELRAELNKTLERFGKMHGLTIHFGDATFDPGTINFQVKVQRVPEEAFNPIQALWEVHCGRIGMDPKDMGKKFTLGGKEYRLTGYNPNTKDNHCLIITCLQDGERFSATPEQVNGAIHTQYTYL